MTEGTYSWAESNPEMLSRLLGLYQPERILDVTFGLGNFWRGVASGWLPRVTAHDIAEDGVDFRDLPYAEGVWECVVLDPPYRRPQGGPTIDVGVNENYGLWDVPLQYAAAYRHIDALYREGIAECTRVLARGGWLIVKAQDSRPARDVRRWGVRDVMGWMEGVGLRVVDIGVVINRTMTPPHVTKHGLRYAHSQFIVGRKPRGRAVRRAHGR